jgi:hypothetical protein
MLQEARTMIVPCGWVRRRCLKMVCRERERRGAGFAVPGAAMADGRLEEWEAFEVVRELAVGLVKKAYRLQLWGFGLALAPVLGVKRAETPREEGVFESGWEAGSQRSQELADDLGGKQKKASEDAMGVSAKDHERDGGKEQEQA